MKIKPCMNDMCYNWSSYYNNHCLICDVPENVLITKRLIDCPKYQPEKPLSAWELFRELNKKYDKFEQLLCDRLCNRVTLCDVLAPAECLISNYNNQEALEILLKIKKEVEG